MTTDYRTSIFYGIARGFCVQPLLSPIETIKTHYQCGTQNTCTIIQQLYETQGPRAFFKGLPHQLLMTCIKQAWVWPLIVHLPPRLQSHGINNILQQILTGITISFLDATITTPLEKARIQAMSSPRPIKFSLPEMYKNGWQGYHAHLAKLSTVWITFLLAQKHFRETNKPLTLPELTIIGIKTAFLVSIVSAPADLANTLMQAQNRRPSIRTLYRGWHLNLSTLLIHNIASSIVMEQLLRSKKT